MRGVLTACKISRNERSSQLNAMPLRVTPWKTMMSDCITPQTQLMCYASWSQPHHCPEITAIRCLCGFTAKTTINSSRHHPQQNLYETPHSIHPQCVHLTLTLSARSPSHPFIHHNIFTLKNDVFSCDCNPLPPSSPSSHFQNRDERNASSNSIRSTDDQAAPIAAGKKICANDGMNDSKSGEVKLNHVEM